MFLGVGGGVFCGLSSGPEKSIKPTIKYIDEQKRLDLIKKNLISAINSTLEKKHKVILVYPVPETGFNVPRSIYNRLNRPFRMDNKNDNVPIFTTSYDVFKKRNRLIFEVLDSIQDDNVYRVYPHKYFCDNQIKNRCVSNSKDTIYYSDDDHLSIQGSAFMVKDIVDIIKGIKN